MRTILANRDWAAPLVERLEKRTVNLGDIPIVGAREAHGASRPPDPRPGEEDPRGRRRPAERRPAEGDRRDPAGCASRVAMPPAASSSSRSSAASATCIRAKGARWAPSSPAWRCIRPTNCSIHILDPNRSVEGNYRAYTVSTDDGRVVTGLLAAESKTAIEIVDAEGKRVAIQRNEIDEFHAVAQFAHAGRLREADQARGLRRPKDRSANGTSASVGRAGRIMRSNSRDWSGWMRPDRGGAEELPIHAQGRIFLVGETGLETALLAGRPHRGMECRQRL